MKARQLLYHPALRALIRIAREEKLPLYLVGGAVRARLCAGETEVTNTDLLVVGEVSRFAAKVAQTLKSRVVVINPQFNTLLIPAGGMELEISAPRNPGKVKATELSLPDQALERDLLLRDFTINAIAEPLSPKRGAFVDPSGGRQDLERRLIRTPIAPLLTLREDPLRLMRAIRFAGELDFAIDPELLEVLHQERASLRDVSVERRTSELLKILLTPKPSIGLKLMYVTGLLESAYPEIAALANLHPGRHHRHKDVFEHTLKVVDTVAAAGASVETRLAALLHDIGKPATRRFDPALGWTFHGHEVIGERITRQLGNTWRLPNNTIGKAAKLVRLHMRPINLTDEEVTDSAVRRLGVQAGEDIEDLLTLCRADVTSADPARVQRYLKHFDGVVEHLRLVNESDQLQAFQSPVRGEVIMQETGLMPGPLVGKLKTMIEEAILEGIIPHDYESALEYLRKIKDEVLASAPE